MHAAEVGTPDMVSYLLLQHADIGARDQSGMAALQYADDIYNSTAASLRKAGVGAMNTTCRIAMEYGAKKRREYVRDVTLSRAMLFLGVTIIVSWGVVLYLVLGNQALFDAVNGYWALFSLGVPVTLGCLGIVGALGIWLWLSSLARLHSLNYVPSIREQIASLPAEEVLLRGSSRPVALAGELLREVDDGVPADAMKLLRTTESTIM